MRITLISFYLRNSLFCRSQASSYNVQQFRNLAAGNTATTVEENEEEPWVDPYNKALPEKKETFSYFREAKVDWGYVERLLPREFVPERKVGGYITPSGWRAPRENPPDLPYYIARGIDNMPRIFLELRRDELNPKTMDFEHVDVVVLREIYGDIFACERDLRIYLEKYLGHPIATNVDELKGIIRIKGADRALVEQFVYDYEEEFTLLDN
uniref:Large ribosomal subunit protein mL49 n=1 Tax=Meloidogyne incognita TaxID=6306 RepID=A0A914LK45_MELIC